MPKHSIFVCRLVAFPVSPVARFDERRSAATTIIPPEGILLAFRNVSLLCPTIAFARSCRTQRGLPFLPRNRHSHLADRLTFSKTNPLNYLPISRLARKSHTLTRIFKGQKKRTGQRKTALLYGNNILISARSDSKEFVPNKEERTLPRASPSVSGFVCVTALDAEAPISASRFGNINPIAFRRAPGSEKPVNANGVCPSLRTD